MFSKTRIPGRAKDRVSLTLSFVCVLLVACLSVLILARLSLLRSHAQYQRQAEITVQNLCAVLADNLVTSYEKIDLALRVVKEDFEQRDAMGDVDAPRLEAFMERQRAKIPVLFALRTATAEGIIDHGNDVPKGSRISVADRDYFLRLKSDPEAGLVFSKPLEGRVTGTWAIILARRIDRRDGSFGGVVYGAMELEKLNAHFASLSIGREGVISLRAPDLSLILRHGRTQDQTGNAMVSPEFQALLKAGLTSGTYTAVTALDQVERIYAFKKLQPYGQYLHTGFGRREVFEPWRQELLQTLGLVTSFLLLLGASGWLAYAAWQHQQRAEAERERVILELQKALAEVKSLSGLLPICSNCKQVRDDHGYWSQIEAYISSHSEAQFTHGICPNCIPQLFPEVFEKRKNRLDGSV